MPQLAFAATVIAIISFIGYLLKAGAIIIWPIFNILAYLKVLIFPRPIRKKYGTDLSKLNKDSFEIEISNKDKNDIKKYKTSKTSLKNKLKIDIESIFGDEYPSKPDGHNWPRSYEQYKNQVGGLQEDMDAVYDALDEYEELIKELQKDIKDLERRKRDK